jgi:hypothetical protein
VGVDSVGVVETCVRRLCVGVLRQELVGVTVVPKLTSELGDVGCLGVSEWATSVV